MVPLSLECCFSWGSIVRLRPQGLVWILSTQTNIGALANFWPCWCKPNPSSRSRGLFWDHYEEMESWPPLIVTIARFDFHNCHGLFPCSSWSRPLRLTIAMSKFQAFINQTPRFLAIRKINFPQLKDFVSSFLRGIMFALLGFCLWSGLAAS